MSLRSTTTTTVSTQYGIMLLLLSTILLIILGVVDGFQLQINPIHRLSVSRIRPTTEQQQQQQQSTANLVYERQQQQQQSLSHVTKLFSATLPSQQQQEQYDNNYPIDDEEEEDEDEEEITSGVADAVRRSRRRMHTPLGQPLPKTAQVFGSYKNRVNTRKGISNIRESNNAAVSAISEDDPEWKFFDTARINVAGGDGGNGCVSFRREKGEARGGPNGGRGGSGGSVYIECDATINTLLPLRQRVHIRATPGKNGLGKNKDGAAGNDIIIRVPVGTVVRDLKTQKYAGELSVAGERLLVAKGGRGGRGNAAFMTARRTAPKLAERGEPGTNRWLSIELKLVADVGFLGKPNAGKSTLLAAASAARPKIANYPFTTIVPNLGVCDLGGGSGLVLLDIPGLIEGASEGVGMGISFLRHVQRCRVLLHVIDGSSEDPLYDFHAINNELREYDQVLADKVQVVIVNKIDIPEVAAKSEQLIQDLKKAAGHTRVLPVSAATTANVQQLMTRLKKLVDAQPIQDVVPAVPEIDITKAGLDYDSDDYIIISDPAYPGQYRLRGEYIEQMARMTHWEYPEAVERFGRQLVALGISKQLIKRGAVDGDLIMIDKYDFEFAPGMTNPWIPADLLLQDEEEFGTNDVLFGSSISGSGRSSKKRMGNNNKEDDEANARPWRPFNKGGYLDVDTDELVGFTDESEWELLEDEDDDDNDSDGQFIAFRGGDNDDDDDDDLLDWEIDENDEVWTSN